MKQTRRKFDSGSKARVALEAIKKRETLQQLAVRSDLKPYLNITEETGVFGETRLSI